MKLNEKEDKHAERLISALTTRAGTHERSAYGEFIHRADTILDKMRKVSKNNPSYDFSPRVFYGLMIRVSKKHGCYVD